MKKLRHWVIPISDFLEVDYIEGHDGLFHAVNAIGEEKVFRHRHEAQDWVLKRPDAPSGDHTCTADSPQPHYDSYRDGDLFMCRLCSWESMAMEFHRGTTISAPRIPRFWEKIVAKNEKAGVKVVESVRDQVRERWGL